MFNRGILKIDLKQFFSYKILVLGLFSVVALGLVLIPSIFLFMGSFSKDNPYEANLVLTLGNYQQLFQSNYILTLLRNTFWVAIFTTVLSGILGVTLAWIITRTDVPLRKLITQLLLIPFYCSPLVGAICWSILAAPRIGLINLFMISLFPSLEGKILLNAYTPAGIIWTMTLYYTPFVFLFTSGALSSMDPSLEESSKMSGASHSKTAIKITLPLVLPAITGGSLLVFVLSLGQFGIPAILGISGKYHVLSTEMYILLSAYPPKYNVAAAMGIFLFMFTAILIYLQSIVLGKKQFTTITGKGFRPRRIKMGKWRIVLFLFCSFYIFISVVLPLGAVIWVSLIKYLVPKLSLAIYTLKNYQEVLFLYPPTKLAIKNSMILSVLGATIGIILTGGISWVLHRTKVPGRKLLEYVSMSPIAIPNVVFAVALLWTWINVPLIYGTIWLLLICYVTIYMPYGIKSTSATLIQIDKSLEESAYVCGGSWFYTLKTVTIPLLKPGIIAGWTLLFIIFSRDLTSSLFLGTSRSVVISVAVLDMYNQGLWGKLGALSVIQTIIVFTMLAMARKIGGREIQIASEY